MVLRTLYKVYVKIIRCVQKIAFCMDEREGVGMSVLASVIKRHFTKDIENRKCSVFDLFEWKKCDVYLVDHKSGRVLTDMKDLEFPSHYSQTACDIIASKYFRKAGVPGEQGYETSMRQVSDRMVSFWVKALVDEGMIDEEESVILYDELVYAILAQMFAPNSPQWFNTGLKLKYGIAGGMNELYYYDEEKGEVEMCIRDRSLRMIKKTIAWS